MGETLTLADLRAYPTFVAYVMFAFLGQALIGLALALRQLVRAWVGWLAAAWNFGWLVALLIWSPGDVYFPVLHLLMPIVIGIALLRPSPALVAG